MDSAGVSEMPLEKVERLEIAAIAFGGRKLAVARRDEDPARCDQPMIRVAPQLTVADAERRAFQEAGVEQIGPRGSQAAVTLCILAWSLLNGIAVAARKRD